MINLKALGLGLVAATTVGVAAPVEANPIINQHQAEIQRAQNMTPAQLNYPRNGGTTTLVQKCEAMKYFQNRFDLGGVARMAFQISFEHPTDHMTTDQACMKVGVNTY
jgi:hypothetical protein